MMRTKAILVSDTATARFWAKVEKTDTCWLWTGHISSVGYGQIKTNQGIVRAHRYAYTLLVGEIEPGLTLDHLCRIKHCVNPAHLEAVSQRINVLRGEGLAARNAQRTHCFRGHPFTPENTWVRSTGQRRCRLCRKEARP